MNTDDLKNLTPTNVPTVLVVKELHPFESKRVVVVMPHGFIHFGTYESIGATRIKLTNASNLRFWTSRSGGLPEFAKFGPKRGDHIDEIGTVIIESVIFIYETGNWS